MSGEAQTSEATSGSDLEAAPSQLSKITEGLRLLRQLLFFMTAGNIACLFGAVAWPASPAVFFFCEIL